MTEEENLCDRTYRAHERQQSKPDKPETPSLPRHSKQNHKGSETQFLYSQLGRVVIKKHTYLTPVTHATYPWNYAQPPGRKSAFQMPKTMYPKR
ncbi:hypothetical protein OS493_032454 [Desmophyllum pertusum]|uniref:Uncharacterized protein n=1 Tax=Desmophyllum pertusum TaxID=174260 RepID=A0A9X0D8Y5_9CNID|nr:hypothetical protein OS493_032454 [Desmophyllum pertusum]